jgi:hypothetical protein
MEKVTQFSSGFPDGRAIYSRFRELIPLYPELLSRDDGNEPKRGHVGSIPKECWGEESIAGQLAPNEASSTI